MTRATLPHAILVLAALLTAATPRASATAGFVDVARAVASHPMYSVLAQYDREIATLRGTLAPLRGGDPATQAQRDGAALARAASTAQLHLAQIGRRTAEPDRELESAAFAAVRASKRDADRAMSAYAAELRRETSALLAGYALSIAQRNQRALAARRQQLHEKELTLAFDLARASAGKRLQLRLKLEHLHLDRAARSRLGGEVAALNSRESNALNAMRRGDAAILASYARELQRAGALDDARMDSQLRAKAAANLTLRRRVARTGTSTGATLPTLSTQAGAFAASYRAQADAGAISASLRDASGDISRRFAQLVASDRRSEAETVVQIRTLRAEREALYRSIVAQILTYGRAAARAHHLATLATGTRPPGSVDLTRAISAELSRF